MIVTKEELLQLRTKYKANAFDSKEWIPMTWEELDEVMARVLSRPDPLALLIAWRKHKSKNWQVTVSWGDEDLIIQKICANPSAVREQGIREGWWK